MASSSSSAVDPGGSKPTPRVVICGGGIIGACTAYYLATKGLAEGVTVVERVEPGCAASGKAGGFLALDYNDSSPMGPLSRLSYRLHAQLAAELGVDVGYRTVRTLQLTAAERLPAGGLKRPRGAALLPDWVDGHVLGVTDIGGPDNTAQVHPYKLTHALIAAAVACGSRLVKGCVEGLQLEEGGEGAGRRVTGVLVDGSVLPADAAVIAMGPWSQAAMPWLSGGSQGPTQGQVQGQGQGQGGGPAGGGAALLPRLSIIGQKYHSVVLRPERPVTDHMLFTGYKTADGRMLEPEVYPRPDGSVYVCGEPDATPLPPSADQVTVESQLVDNIRRVAGSMASCLGTAPVEARQSCYLPCAPDSLPVIGPVPGCSGAYLATGHTCWGILNGPATGLLLAELIAEGRTASCDIGAFSPARFAARA